MPNKVDCTCLASVASESLASVVANYENIQLLWETAVRATSDTEMKAKDSGSAESDAILQVPIWSPPV